MERIRKNTDSEENLKLSDLSKRILEMKEIDQAMRTGDTAEWDMEVDRRNTTVMKEIIADIGWPTFSKVGDEASRAAWLLVQHADEDPGFQSDCLALMKEQAAGEVHAGDMAYLEDRIRVNTQSEQIYGTQMREARDEAGVVIKYEPQPIEVPEQVNTRRASVGLEPIEDYIRRITERYHPHLLQRPE